MALSKIKQDSVDTPIAGTGPAFSAYQSSTQSFGASVGTKVQFQTKVFDTATAFDNTTNYRFTPQVAGYYQINAGLSLGNTSGITVVYIYKNGVQLLNGNFCTASSSSTQTTVSGLLYLNGSTDYVEIYGYQNSAGSVNSGATSPNTYFQAFLARAA